MSNYVLPHELKGERQRLDLMSALLDPIELAHFKQLGINRGWRCLEVGSGNGSISRALAELVSPNGSVVASDIDLRYLQNIQMPQLDIRSLDILRDPLEENHYDFVVARALLHHLTPAQKALEIMARALKPGGVLLSIEPDMLPCTVAEPTPIRAFWKGWLQWSAENGIDYFIGRKVPGWLDTIGLEQVSGEGHTALFSGGSDWAEYWKETVRELTPALLKSSHLTETMLANFHACFQDPRYWTSVITFTATWGHKAP
jgi:SAM-dependent methyltransferase